MARKVTIEVEILNDAIPDDRIAYMVFGALDRSRIRAVQVGDARAADEITKTDEQRVVERMADKRRRAAATEAKHAESETSEGGQGKPAAGEGGASA